MTFTEKVAVSILFTFEAAVIIAPPVITSIRLRIGILLFCFTFIWSILSFVKTKEALIKDD